MVMAKIWMILSPFIEKLWIQRKLLKFKGQCIYGFEFFLVLNLNTSNTL